MERPAPPPAELIVLDGKEPNHTRGQRVLTAVTVPSQHYLGCAMVADKSNEIPPRANSLRSWTRTAAPSA